LTTLNIGYNINTIKIRDNQTGGRMQTLLDNPSSAEYAMIGPVVPMSSDVQSLDDTFSNLPGTNQGDELEQEFCSLFVPFVPKYSTLPHHKKDA
jgi:hypothetical protein